jgi:hypothetical protein
MHFCLRVKILTVREKRFFLNKKKSSIWHRLPASGRGKMKINQTTNQHNWLLGNKLKETVPDFLNFGFP